MTKPKLALCESFLKHLKWQSQLYTLHPSSIYRRHRTRPVSVMSFYGKTFIIIEAMVRTLYLHDYDEENK